MTFRHLVLLALSVTSVSGCGDGSVTQAPAPPPESDAPPPLFTDITRSSGLPEPPADWPDGTWFMPEIMGPGVGLLDFDGDGDLDIIGLATPPPGHPEEPAPNRLWRQEPDGRFVEIGSATGLGDPGFAQGVAAGDVDNDGDVDVYFANYGPDAFYLNDGDGTFTRATARAGFTGDLWSSSAVFCDYDLDGYSDLYVTHYLRFHPGTVCPDASGRRDYCGPKTFPGEPDTLYRNNGNGTFSDVTTRAGLVLPSAGAAAKGLGVVCADLTGDGFPDFFVANDGEPTQLWVNRGDGTFADEAFMRAVAVNRAGRAEAGMGIAIGDVTGDGRLDLYVTHLLDENNTLYAGGPEGMFADLTADSRLGLYDLPFTGFGTAFLDFDLDGDLDIAVVNGRVYRGRLLEGASGGEFWSRYAEPNQLFENDGTGRFTDISERSSVFAGTIEVGRGLAAGDIDGDGDVDLVLSNADNSIRLLRNDAPADGRHWLVVRAMEGARDSAGAVITAVAGNARIVHLATAAGSYMSTGDPRAHFGLDRADRYEAIEVIWPGGMRERFEGGAADRLVTVRKGTGERLR